MLFIQVLLSCFCPKRLIRSWICLKALFRTAVLCSQLFCENVIIRVDCNIHFLDIYVLAFYVDSWPIVALLFNLSGRMKRTAWRSEVGTLDPGWPLPSLPPSLPPPTPPSPCPRRRRRRPARTASGSSAGSVRSTIPRSGPDPSSSSSSRPAPMTSVFLLGWDFIVIRYPTAVNLGTIGNLISRF